LARDSDFRSLADWHGRVLGLPRTCRRNAGTYARRQSQLRIKRAFAVLRSGGRVGRPLDGSGSSQSGPWPRVPYFVATFRHRFHAGGVPSQATPEPATTGALSHPISLNQKATVDSERVSIDIARTRRA